MSDWMRGPSEAPLSTPAMILLPSSNNSSSGASLDRLLSETEADDWPGQVRWLNE